MAFGDVLAGWGQAAHEHHVNLLQMEYENRQKAAQVYAEFAKNPDLAPEQRSFLMQGALAHLNYPEKVPAQYKFDPEKPEVKIPVSVPQPTPPPITAPGSPGGAPTPGTLPTPATQQGMNIPIAGSPSAPPTPDQMGSPGTPQGYATAAINPQQVQPPTPPPQTVMRSPFQPMSPQEMAQIQSGTLRTLGKAQSEVAGETAGAQERAKLQATYGDPQVVDAMIRMKQLEQPIVPVAPGYGVASRTPEGGIQLAGGTGRIKNEAENLDNAAVMSVMKKHGVSTAGLREDLPYMQQVTPEFAIEAATELERIRKTPDPALEMMRIESIRQRELQQEMLGLQIKQFSATKGQEALDNYRNLVNENPNAIKEIPSDMKGRVISYMRTKGDRVPRDIPSPMQETEYNADQTLQRIQRVRGIIQKYPDLIGPVANAIGKGQEVTGVALTDPDKAAAMEDLRGSLTFLSTAEAKALLGSRPAFSWAQKFNDVTSQQKDQLPIMTGALGMQEAHARMILDGIDRQRYGTQKAGAPSAPRANGYGPEESRTLKSGETVKVRKNLATNKYEEVR